MSSENSILVQNISKCFRIYQKPSDRLKQFFFKNKKSYKEFWALDNISFEIPKGSIVGIIGKNGSGKSTLLQIIAKTMNPTSGAVYVNGNVSALLELGSGFNPEFSGRENIYMNATLLGMSREQIEEKIDEIIEFADIGDFIDRQVKTYSSGMFVRLAFSVSTCLKPEILIVDEALSVGDVAFQKKCFDRIKQLINTGTTVLLVSHDMSTIRMLCDKVIYLQNGKIHAMGSPKEVVDEYMRNMLGKDDHLANKEEYEINTLQDRNVEWSQESWDLTPDIFKYEYIDKNHKSKVNGSLKAIIEKCIVLDHDFHPVSSVYSREKYFLRCYIRVMEHINYFNVGVLLRDKYGQDIFGQSMHNLNLEIDTEFNSGDIIICDIELDLNIKHGTYFVTLGLQDGEFNEIYFYGTDLLMLNLEPNKNPIFGVVEIPCSFNVNQVHKQDKQPIFN